MSRSLRGVAVVALIAPVLIGTLPAHAAVLTAEDILTQFNAMVSNNFSTQHDVEGRLVAGTISNSSSSTFYNNPNSSSAPSAFQAVNANTISSCPSCNVNNGGSVNFVTSNAGTFNLNGGGSVSQNNPAFAMSDFTTPLDALRAKLAGMMANSTVTSGLDFIVAPVDGVAVFDITGAQLAT
jgi:choice-of-anchor A domain-containing protein